MFNEVKTTGAHWNLIKKATNPKVRKTIGPLKRDDDTLALADPEKACLMNSYFATIGEKLASALPVPDGNDGNETVEVNTEECVVPPVAEFNVSCLTIRKKINALKTNKSTCPDNIQPRLLKLEGDAIVPPLVDLYRYSIKSGTVFNSWKVARLTPIFKRDDETDRGNYRPISILGVPSKILEFEANDTLVRHAFKENQL